MQAERLVSPSQIARDLLSPREFQILCLLAQGYSNIDISLELDLSEKTVRNKLSIIYDVLGVTTRVQAARWALREGCATLAPSPVERAAVRIG